uniref:Rad50/SbcC-type AAA domain-containing protein n=1 Tax=viral metagenome TaxID=1070528 RepID=A0A6C0M299_9ZZZZ
MKIRFHNFRCYADSTFEFDTKGLQLISGGSGHGKTTILEGILFVLYDAVKSPYSFDSKPKDKCYVEMTLDDMYVYRSRRPNVVRVKTSKHPELSMTEAQSVIETRFGTLHEFMASSYVKQGLHSSILTLTPTDQLRFIERLAYDREGHEYISQCIKAATKQADGVLIAAQTAAKLTSVQCRDVKMEHAEREIRAKPDVVKSEALVAKTEITEHLTAVRKTKVDLQRKIERAKVVEVDLRRLVDQEKTLRIEISQLEQRISGTAPTMTIEQRASLEATTEDIRSRIALAERSVQYERAKRAYDDARRELRDGQKERIAELTKDLVSPEWIESLVELENSEKETTLLRDRVDTAAKNVSLAIAEMVDGDFLSQKSASVQAYLNALGRKKKIYSMKLKRVQSSIETHAAHTIRTQIYTCPSCSTKVTIDTSGVMVACTPDVHSNTDATDIESLRTELASIQDVIKMVDAYTQRIQDNYELSTTTVPPSNAEKLAGMRSAYEAHKRASKEIASSKDSLTTSKTLLRLKREMEALIIDTPLQESDIDTIALTKTVNDNVKTLETEWKLSSEYNLLRRDMKEKTASADSMAKTIAGLRTSNNITRSLDAMVAEYDELQNEFDTSYKHLEYATDAIRAWEKYDEYTKASERVAEWEAAEKKALYDLNVAEARATAVLSLKNIGRKAEILALDTMMININEHAKYYIGMMFPDGSMSVTLENIMRSKKGSKCGMNVSIVYKGSEYSDINQLSGGERDRINLCFVLAINSMMNSSMLMLDESLSSLDSDTNTEIFTMLREIAENKCILIVSHEATRGIFDKIHTLKQE